LCYCCSWNCFCICDVGANYGHKPYEGPCLRHSADECPVSDEFEEPFYWYQHRENKDGCVAGSAFVPEGLWPEEYKFLFIDVSSVCSISFWIYIVYDYHFILTVFEFE
jgi:hypothetical protein